MRDINRIYTEDIAAFSVLPFNLYNTKGAIACRKGTLLDSKVLSKLSLQELYKENPLLSESASSAIVSKISTETTNILISITRELLEACEKGNEPPIKALFEARNRIFDEVVQNINEIDHIGQLRIHYNDYELTHGINVSTLSTALGIKMGFNKEEIQALALGALLHDIGKTKIPKQIINKPDKLSPKEYEVIKLHSPLGFKIIKDEYGMPPAIAAIALDHHERYNGAGYTRSIVGDQINNLAQIVSIADVFDASSSDKAYAKAKEAKIIIKEMLKSTSSFNPRILYTLVHMVNYNTGGLKEKITMIN